MKNRIEDANLIQLDKNELKKIDGGLVFLAALAIGVAWAGIGATVCWAMGVDNRE